MCKTVATCEERVLAYTRPSAVRHILPPGGPRRHQALAKSEKEKGRLTPGCCCVQKWKSQTLLSILPRTYQNPQKKCETKESGGTTTHVATKRPTNTRYSGRRSEGPPSLLVVVQWCECRFLCSCCKLHLGTSSFIYIYIFSLSKKILDVVEPCKTYTVKTPISRDLRA